MKQMIKILNCKNKNYKKKLVKFLDKRRSRKSIDTIFISKILNDVKKNKLKAVIKYERLFSKNSKIYASKNEINATIKKLDSKTRRAIDFAYSRIYRFHSLQKPKDIKFIDKYKNKIDYKNVPLQSVGIYVPSNLPSTLLMCAIPAQISKVKKIIVANPRTNGKLNSAVMYAAKKCGVTEVITCGGAQAIGNLAYIQKVNKVIGPGSDITAEAKKLVYGVVGIDSLAGPSEILVLADKKTNINEIGTSLVGQSEHSPESQCILVTKNKEIINKVEKNISENLKNLPRKKIALQSLKKHGLIVVCQNDKQIVDVINECASEHIELNVLNYKKYINNIVNAGSICIGKYTPMAVTDYNSGTQHTLPTLGSSKYSSGLNLNDFYKKISYVKLSKKGVAKIGKFAIHLSDFENLKAHSKSIKSRIRRG
tara:strand:- start:243 stop:1514 length:1272 start_codon:yes stop_codon:yes gene_type:complete